MAAGTGAVENGEVLPLRDDGKSKWDFASFADSLSVLEQTLVIQEPEVWILRYPAKEVVTQPLPVQLSTLSR